MKPARIGIIGSANVDLVVRADHAPGPGENVFGDDFRMIPGGKGANQAVAVARLGGRARFIGRVGRDSFGEMLLASLRADGVETGGLAAVADAPTGAALIVIDRKGQNSIVVAPGANRRLMPADIQALRPALEKLDAILMQLEIPIETVVHTIRLAREINVPVILDAGPPRAQPPDEVFRVAILSPNEAEAGALLGRAIRDLKDAEEAGREMLRRGAGAVVLKLGSKGALLVTEDECLHVPAHRGQSRGYHRRRRRVHRRARRLSGRRAGAAGGRPHGEQSRRAGDDETRRAAFDADAGRARRDGRGLIFQFPISSLQSPNALRRPALEHLPWHPELPFCLSDLRATLLLKRR